MQELNDRRSLQRSLKRNSVFTSDAAEAVNERTRFTIREYGTPLFQIDEVVTIVKDTTPGVHFRHSYDKIGRVTNVVVGDINIYTVKVLFENYSEEVDELWLKKYDPGMANTKARVSKKQRTLNDKNIVIANLQGKLRVERKKSRGAQLNLQKSDKIIEVLTHQSENMAEQIASFLCSDIVNENVVRKSNLIQHMMDQITVFTKSAHRENATLKSKVFLQEQEIEKINMQLQEKTEELDDLASDLRDLLGEKSKWDTEMKKLEGLMKENSSLHEDNEMLLRELDELDREDAKYNPDTQGRFCTGFKCLIIRLFRLRLSNKQVQVVIEEMMSEMKIEEYVVPSISTLSKIRSDLGPICDVLSAIKLCRATRWLQLGHDGSTIVDKDTTSASIVVQYGDGKLEKIILSSSFLCEDKSAQATYEGIVSLVDRIKVRYTMFLKELGSDAAQRYPHPDGINFAKMRCSSLMSDNDDGALNTSSLLADYITHSVEEFMRRRGSDLEAMSEEERKELSEIIQTRCFAHVRCICADRGVEAENKWMADCYNVPEDWKKDIRLANLMKSDLGSLIYSVQKYVWDKDLGPTFTKLQDFQTFLSKNNFRCKSMGGRMTGNRMDKDIENGLKFAVDYKKVVCFRFVRLSTNFFLFFFFSAHAVRGRGV